MMFADLRVCLIYFQNILVCFLTFTLMIRIGSAVPFVDISVLRPLGQFGRMILRMECVLRKPSIRTH